MDITQLSYADGSKANIFYSKTNTQGEIAKVLDFNAAFYRNSGQNADVYTAYEMKGGNYGGRQIFGVTLS